MDGFDGYNIYARHCSVIIKNTIHGKGVNIRPVGSRIGYHVAVPGEYFSKEAMPLPSFGQRHSHVVAVEYNMQTGP